MGFGQATCPRKIRPSKIEFETFQQHLLSIEYSAFLIAENFENFRPSEIKCEGYFSSLSRNLIVILYLSDHWKF